MLVIVTEEGPVFVNVTVLALLVTPNPVLAKVRLVGLRLTVNAATPVPESGALFGLVEEFVVKVSAAARAPDAEGVNLTPTAQFNPTPSVPPQALEEIAKSAAFAPVKVMLVIVKVAEPVFVSVTVCELVVTPTTMFPNDKLEGVKPTAGAAGGAT